MNTNVKKYVVKEYVIKEYLEDLKNPGDIVRAQIMESVNDEEMMAQCPNDIFFLINEKELILIKKPETKAKFLKILERENIRNIPESWYKRLQLN